MLDLFGITFSGIMMMIVAFRAVQLDAAQDWFRRTPQTQDDANSPSGNTAPASARGHRRWQRRS